MEHRTAEIAQAFETPAGGARGLLSLHQYELLFEMTTQLLAAQSLDEQVSLVLDTLTAGLGYASAALRCPSPAVSVSSTSDVCSSRLCAARSCVVISNSSSY